MREFADKPDNDLRANSMPVLISCVIYVSSPTSEAQELPGFGLTGEMAEEHTGSCLKYRWTDKGERLGSVMVQLFHGGLS